ncbi:MBL fold metallo-hydrolase [Spiractinospora alimapuensis]|uniref:MBL fold metallo-hydrolase n=1 Tax=Spiractinospora alimapuensis TaxID=2820884 RepID=UPI001F2D7110|nr:MBL fold metallo-hydrolase [Spiractinospora alimapuensis]QVQ50368.1 MBL fold metallo-hydrolase [Spiractinospora alimapuensis]
MKIDGSGTTRATAMLCPNPGPMTLDGTNTWVVREPDAHGVVVVDPGPHHERHLERVARSLQERGAHVELVLLTHHHPDHAEGAPYFAELTGAPVRAVDPDLVVGDTDSLRDGETIKVAGLELRVVATPGHTPDSVSFHLPADRSILTGDTVLGRGSTVLGEAGLGDYMDTLARLEDLIAQAGVVTLLPGHGPLISDAAGAIATYRGHRQERLDQIRAAIEAGARSPREIVARVYTEIDDTLIGPALASVRAQLDFLRSRGETPDDLRFD